MELVYQSEEQTEFLNATDFGQIIPCPKLLYSSQIKPEFLALVCVYGQIIPVKQQFGTNPKYLLIEKNNQFAIILDRLPEWRETETNILPFPSENNFKLAA